MKNLMLFSSIFAAGSLFAAATVESSSSVGVLNVSTGATLTNQLVAVPFGGYETNGKISVLDVVATNGLAYGTLLRAINTNNNTYATWQMTASGWEPVSVVAVDSQAQVSEPPTTTPAEAIITRGSSFWIEFPCDANGLKQPTTLTLLGKKDDATGVNLATNRFNLVGNGCVTNVDILVSGKIDGAGAGDKIYVQQADGRLITYTYVNGKGWRRVGKLAQELNAIWIQPGQGFWFLPKNATRFNF